MKKKTTKTKQKKTGRNPYQVPRHIYLILERTAEQRRKNTGKNIIWSDILREILNEALGHPSE